MNKLSIHIPTFVQAETTPCHEFNTLEELLQICRIKSYTSTGDHLELSGKMLLCVSECKLWWWVIGHLKSTEGVDLPEWKAYYKVKFEDGRVEVRDDVVLSSGCWVQLKDGTTATNLLV